MIFQLIFAAKTKTLDRATLFGGREKKKEERDRDRESGEGEGERERKEGRKVKKRTHRPSIHPVWLQIIN